MLEGFTGLITYLVLKLAGYSAWSYLGLRLFDGNPAARTQRAIQRGLFRLAIGWGTGILVAPFALIGGTDRIPLFYFTALAVVRWLEWGVLQWTYSSSRSDAGMLLTAGSQRGAEWRLGGILISYLADAPFLIAGGGFPKGRLFC